MNSTPDAPGSVERRLAWLGLGGALALSLGSFCLSTQHGLGLGNDSHAFIAPALAHLRGEATISLHHPPLFGWLIWSLATLTGQDVVECVRYIQLVATIAIVCGVWWPVRWALPSRPHFAGAAALLTAICFPLVEAEGNVGSDQLGVAFAVWSLALLARYLAVGQLRWLAGCAAIAALAFLNRFAAFGLLLSISTVIWLRRGRPFGRDFFAALGLGLVMVTPCAWHLMRNVAATGEATGRHIVWNGIPWDRVREALATLSIWYLPNQIARWPVGAALLLLVGALLWTHRSTWRLQPTTRALVLTLGGFGVVNFFFLIVTIALVEYGQSLDSRTLLPCVPISIAFGTLAAGLAATKTIARVAAAGTFLVLFGLMGHRAGSLVASYSVMGRGHLGVTARQSVLPDFVRAHPTATFITNNPPYFFNLVRADARELPAEYSILTNLRYPAYDAEVAAVKRRLRDRDPAYLVVFDVVDVDTRASPQQMMAGDRFRRVMNDYFVSVYQFAGPASDGKK